jgi:hypothetical protein
MAAVVGAIDGIVGTDKDAMRPDKEAFPPRRDQGAVPLENLNGTGTAEEDENTVATIAGNRHGLPVLPSCRKLRPSGIDPIAEMALANADFETGPYSR